MATKVTFSLPAELVENATSGLLLGDFNNWNESNGISLKKQKDGSMKAVAALEAGQTYQYRFLLNDGRWVNDADAQHYAEVHGLSVHNSVITVSDAAPSVEKVVKAKKATPKVKVADVVTVVADDLTKIEGIGKKISELLVAENITSFKALSKVSTKKLQTILDAAGSKFAMHNPSSWAKQSKLAAAGSWDELELLQKDLLGGK